MKLSELKPCAVCRGVITPIWYVLRISQAMLKPQAANGVLGLAQMYGGIAAPGALRIAEAMAPEPDCVMIFGDKEPSMMTELNVCQPCFLGRLIEVALLMEESRKEEPVTS